MGGRGATTGFGLEGRSPLARVETRGRRRRAGLRWASMTFTAHDVVDWTRAQLREKRGCSPDSLSGRGKQTRGSSRNLSRKTSRFLASCLRSSCVIMNEANSSSASVMASHRRPVTSGEISHCAITIPLRDTSDAEQVKAGVSALGCAVHSSWWAACVEGRDHQPHKIPPLDAVL